MSGFFYNLGKMASPKARQGKWMWQSATGTEAEALQAEYEMGRELAREVKTRVESEPDPQAGRLLSEIGAKLVNCLVNKARKFAFEPVKGAEPNAFALPGGFIFITVPMLKLCEFNRDEIAFTLGHEMAHVIKGHAAERILTASGLNILSAAAPAAGRFAPLLRKTGMKFIASAYSQDNELESDEFGFRLASAAGFNPSGGVQMLSRLAQLTRNRLTLPLGTYFSSHPSFDIRIRNLKNLRT